jgi:hypothetical protein
LHEPGIGFSFCLWFMQVVEGFMQGAYHLLERKR